MNKFGRITSVVDNLFFLRNSLAYGRQIYFYRLKLVFFVSLLNSYSENGIIKNDDLIIIQVKDPDASIRGIKLAAMQASGY